MLTFHHEPDNLCVTLIIDPIGSNKVILFCLEEEKATPINGSNDKKAIENLRFFFKMTSMM